jgi:ribonuclease J
MSSSFEWWPLGGLGEVGMNCMVFRLGNTVLPVDAGILFADANDFGIEAVFPDFRSFLTTHKPKAWIITHAHEDHIGAIGPILHLCRELGIPYPVFYAPPFAAALIREKVQERKPPGCDLLQVIQSVDPGSHQSFADVDVHWIETRHSTPESCSLAIHWKTPDLKIIHTADFKIDTGRFPDGVKTEDIFDAFGGRSPDFLFVDSTNAERPGHSVSELEILDPLKKLIASQTGRVFVTLFSSNLFRVASLMNLAPQVGRRVALAGRGMQTAHRLASELGLYGRSCPTVNLGAELSLSDLMMRPKSEQLIICSGSQGEPRSALQRIANDSHSELTASEGDSVIFSSKLIPGNEGSVGRLINALLRKGVHVFSGEFAKVSAGGPVHASGHARRDEIARVLRRLKPAHVVPVHGELRHLQANRDLALELGPSWGLEPHQIHVVENRHHLVFSKRGAEWVQSDHFVEEYEGQYLRFESFVSHSREDFLRQRKRAAQGGVCFATLDSMGRARITAMAQGPVALDTASLEKWLSGQFGKCDSENGFDGPRPDLEAELAEELTRVIKRSHGLRPLVAMQLIRL